MTAYRDNETIINVLGIMLIIIASITLLLIMLLILFFIGLFFYLIVKGFSKENYHNYRNYIKSRIPLGRKIFIFTFILVGLSIIIFLITGIYFIFFVY